jgi:two-component system sensor histidine kinase/response regulator
MSKVLFFCCCMLFCWAAAAQKTHTLDSLEKALTHYPHEDTTKVQLLNRICWENRLLNFAKAAHFGKRGLALAKRLDYQIGIIKSLSFLGVTYINEGNHPLALQNFLEALEYAEKNKNYVEIAYTYNNLGKLYYNEKNAKLYKQYFAKALEYARKTTNQDVLAYSLRNVAFGYEEEKNYPKALQYHLEALKIREHLHASTYLISALHLTGACYAELGDFKNAFLCFDRALRLTPESNTILDRADVLNAKARAFLKMNNYDSALRCVTESYQIAQQKNAWEWIKIAADIYYNIYYTKKDYSQALQYHVIRSTYEDSIMNEGRMIKIKQLVLKHEFEEKERERAVIEEKKDILQTEELKRVQLYLAIVLVALIASVVVGYLLLRAKRQQETNNWLLTKKNEQIAAQAHELSLQAEQLKELNSIKNKLFSIISHDLRSPFSALAGALPLLETGSFTPEETSLILSDIKRMTDSASEMLENLLQWARSQMNTIRVNPEQLVVWRLVQQKVALYTEIAKNKSITIVNQTQPTAIVYADRNHVLLILRNLIGNAIKFTPEGGKIFIYAQANELNNSLIISVKDTGVGMNETTRHQIFGSDELFSTQGTAGEKGTGLGLLLCKEFVEKNGGKIWVESELGIGTTFSFSLPIQ